MASTNKIHMIIIFIFSIILLIFTNTYLSMTTSIPEIPIFIQRGSCFPPPIRGRVPDFGRHRLPEPDPEASPPPSG
ncbi:hypothetical protein IHE45_17G021100 [Dioscorea alata]|uniref:Uncharacterized protein n=1 Tax=Dioscorea alata TaxID=55571 RepID=A0ACB7UAV9_DIOAL|nr:hypothetical protein IHE45_17G021100 [Dioscorea alata]